MEPSGTVMKPRGLGTLGSVVTVMGAQLQALTSCHSEPIPGYLLHQPAKSYLQVFVFSSHVPQKLRHKAVPCPALPYAQANERPQVSPAETTHST